MSGSEVAVGVSIAPLTIIGLDKYDKMILSGSSNWRCGEQLPTNRN